MIQAGKDTQQFWERDVKESLSGILDLQAEGREEQRERERGEASKGI